MNNQQIIDALLANSGANAGMHRFASSNGSSNEAALFSLLSQHQQQPNSQVSASDSNSNSNSGLIQALLQHQQQQHQQMQREEQEKALLLQKLKELTNPAPQASTDELAMLLLQQKQQMQNPSSFGMMGSNPFWASNMSANFASAAPNQFDAATLSKLLRAQQVGAPSVTANGPAFTMSAAMSNNAVPQGLETAGLPMPGDRRRKGRTGTFPQKLHQMLSDLERQEGGVEIASFLPHGRAFAIHKPRDFVKHVMPKYFRMSRFSSFQRQLNLYDFQRITEGPDKGSYYHELFVQGRPILSTMMKRNKIKGVKNNKNNDSSANAASATNANGAADDDEVDDAEDEV